MTEDTEILNAMRWPRCVAEGCTNRVCLWARELMRCFPCAEKLVGRAEIERLYSATHDGQKLPPVPRFIVTRRWK